MSLRNWPSYNQIIAKFWGHRTFCQSLIFIIVLSFDINKYTTKISKYIIVQIDLITNVRFLWNDHLEQRMDQMLCACAPTRLSLIPGGVPSGCFPTNSTGYCIVLSTKYTLTEIETFFRVPQSYNYHITKSWFPHLLAGWLTYFLYTSISSSINKNS